MAHSRWPDRACGAGLCKSGMGGFCSLPVRYLVDTLTVLKAHATRNLGLTQPLGKQRENARLAFGEIRHFFFGHFCFIRAALTLVNDSAQKYICRK